MTIMEACRAIESNRPTSGYTMLNEALDMALDALWEQECRNTMPLGLAELRKMDGQKAYCLDVNTEVTVHAPRVGLITVSYSHYILKATEVTLYRERPGRDADAGE